MSGGECGMFFRLPCSPGRGGFRQRAAQPRDGLRRFRPPLFPPEARVRGPVPFESFTQALACFVHTGQFKSHHAVPRFQEELLEFCRSIRSGARLADARLNLFPVSHG